MKNTFVPQDIAKQLKELGFSEPCLAWWFEEGEISQPTEGRSFWSDWNVNPRRISAPLWQQVTEWFREKHDINIFVGYRMNVKKWDCHAYSLTLTGKEYAKERTMKKFLEMELYDDYNKALEAGVKEAILKIQS